MKETKEKVIIGVDVSKETLDIWVHPFDQHEVIKNTPRSVGQCLKRLQKHYVIQQVGLEPTGGYEKLLVRQLKEKGISVTVIHPNHLVGYQKGERRFAKTDKIAASVIAAYVVTHGPKLKEVSKNYVELSVFSEIASRINQIKRQCRAEENRLEKVQFDKAMIASIKRHIRFLEKEKIKLTLYADEKIKSNAEMFAKAKLLKSFKGIGDGCTRTLLLSLPELGKINKRAISSLVGLAPMNRDSGKKLGHRYIFGGRADVRSMLYMGAVSAIKWNAPMKVIYERLRAAGKPAKVAIVAVMRHMIMILNAMLRDMKPWKSATN